MKKIQLSFFWFFLILALVSCKKTALNNEDHLGISNISAENGLKSNIKSADVINWLEKNKNPLTPHKNSTIQNLLQNLEFDKIHVVRFNRSEKLIIIPLKKVYFSQHINLTNPRPLQYLILVENEAGKIRRSDMVLFYPRNTNLKTLPENSFSDFFNKESFPEDGTFTLISLGDVKQYEMDFKDGRKAQFRLWQNRKIGNSSLSNTDTSNLDTWTNWYLVTTYYYTDGTSEVVEEFLGSTCSCGSGGTYNDPTVDPTPTGGGSDDFVSRPVELTVKRELTSYEDWEIVGTFTLNGMTSGNAANNYFISITYQFSVCDYYSFLASTTVSSAPRYSIYSEVSHQLGLTSQTVAFGKVNSLMTYPNLPGTYGGSGQTFLYNMTGLWQASIDLY